jgi:predicted nucleotidyltransferase
MNKKQLQELIKTEEYSFLRTNSKINNNNICLLTLGGSHAYGTSNPNSDIDIRGVYSHSKSDILSMNCADKPIVHTPTDTTIYPVKQIIKLLSNCNPNTLEILGTRDEHLIYINSIGRLLRDNRDVFLSQIATHSFSGYATAQLRRLQNALARDSYPQAEKEKHILGSINNQNPHIQRNYRAFDDLNIKLYLDDSEILEGKGINTYRENDLPLLMALRNGDYVEEGNDYGYIFELIDDYEKRFNYAKKHTELPKKPDYDKINELVIEINREVLDYE